MINEQKKYSRAIFWLKGNSRLLPIFPLRGLLVFAIFIGLIIAVALLVDRELGILSTKGRVVTPPWEIDNQLANSENYKKILNTLEKPIFRSLGYAPAPVDPNRKRILVIGDSFIWGDGFTNINTIWWRQLQWELERRGYFNVDVVAAGTNGASTQDQFVWLMNPSFLESVRPDTIIFGYVTNDPAMKDSEGKYLVKQFTPPRRITETIKSSVIGKFLPNLISEIDARIHLKMVSMLNGNANGFSYTTWELKILEGENFRHYQLLLQKLAGKFRDLNIPAFFVTTPNAPSAESFEARYAPIRPAFAKAGIEFYDLLPPLLKCCSSGIGQLMWTVNPANGHPGPYMTNYYARHVADILESRHAEALGPRAATLSNGMMPAINDWMPVSVMPKSTGFGEWVFDYPRDAAQLFRMPVDEPHIALNFERPVSIRKVRLSSGKPGDFKMWAMLLDDAGNHELKDYSLIGQGAGADVSLTLPSELSGKRITSLRIAHHNTGNAKEVVAILDSSKITLSSERVYYYPLPEMVGEANNNATPKRSSIILMEDGKPLPHPHSLYEKIREAGHGRYLHWEEGIMFSSSDGSDPRTNGRQYSIGRVSGDAVKIHIDFNSPAVRL